MAQVNLGRIGFVNKGSWNIATNYKLNDVVRYGGSTYAAKRPNVGITPPTNGTDTDDWFYFVNNSGDYVDKTSNQDITGIKNFIVSPKVPTPTTDTQAANKAYVDSASGSTAVKLTGNQTIAGVKTFSSNIVGNITGNADSATKLATARTINGVAFDGSTNITISANADATAVKLTGNQTIADVKTFSSSPIVPTPTDNTQAANKAYVDSKTSSGSYTQSLSANGWTKLPNGLIIQWGNCSEGTNTLPITFPNAFFAVNATLTPTANEGSANSASILSRSSFNYQLGGSNTQYAYYIAVGY